MIKTTKKQINRENLLNEGVTLLMEQGYHGTGLKAILDAVKIPKGSFYNYFDSKEHFGAEVIRHYIEPFITKQAAHLQKSQGDALAGLGCLLGNLMGEIGDTSDLCQKSLQAALNRYRDSLKSGLAKAQQQGTIRTDKSAEYMADLLVNAWQGALLRMKIEKSSAPLKQCCRDLLGDFFKA
ncbi:MAG: TetR family transcriptional regulator C-terminal domain-containing protein [Methylobacter sp.]|nr:TetR family transcriptional regulator C-terminal domain-containing protein [Methylobacter sp.]